jgi:uncharacterized protein
VLPGATPTEFSSGSECRSTTDFPPEMIMGATDLVDAALAGFDQGELVTIRSLPDVTRADTYAPPLAASPH